MDDELELILKDGRRIRIDFEGSSHVPIEVSSWHLPRGTKETREKSLALSRPSFELRTCRIQVLTFTYGPIDAVTFRLDRRRYLRKCGRRLPT
jgi:hypothetical protein